MLGTSTSNIVTDKNIHISNKIIHYYYNIRYRIIYKFAHFLDLFSKTFILFSLAYNYYKICFCNIISIEREKLFKLKVKLVSINAYFIKISTGRF